MINPQGYAAESLSSNSYLFIAKTTSLVITHEVVAQWCYILTTLDHKYNLAELRKFLYFSHTDLLITVIYLRASIVFNTRLREASLIPLILRSADHEAEACGEYSIAIGNRAGYCIEMESRFSNYYLSSNDENTDSDPEDDNAADG